MAKIIVNNPRQVISGGAKKYYFKVKGLGGPKGDKGDKGDTGSQGPQGPQGNAATISVGSTTTLAVGQDATVQNVGTLYNAVLDFGIPQGPQGPQGAKGDKGDTGAKGDTGPRGPQGDRGTNATVTVGTTITTEPGTQAYAWNSSSNPNNAVINFNIPRGATGSQGPQGIQGPIGPAGADGKSFTPVVVSSLPSTGEEGKLYLTPKNYTTGTATGNPITISLSEDAGQITSFKLDGDTYQQTYTGKNLLRLSDGTMTLGGVPITTTNGTVNLKGTATSRGQGYYVSIDITASEPMVFSANKSGTTSGLEIKLQYKRGGTTYYPTVGSSFYLQAGDIIQQMYLIIPNGSVLDGSFSPMLEVGSAATSFEPYVGGQPSPNPSYPQPIQTVTGEQTVSINDTDYPISLGSIELCKIGTYQDYIWKDGEDWKVHKAVAKHALKPNEGWLIPNPASYPNLFQTNAISDLGNLSDAYTAASTSLQAYCEALVYLPGSGDVRTTQGFSLYHTVEGGAAYNIARINIAGFTTTTQLNNWLSTCNANFWYGVKIPTDTIITDQTLIAQLEAIRTASLENGANTITNVATGSNLAGDMEIDYYGYNPTNRYDKWLWLDLNNNYEQIGS